MSSRNVLPDKEVRQEHHQIGRRSLVDTMEKSRKITIPKILPAVVVNQGVLYPSITTRITIRSSKNLRLVQDELSGGWNGSTKLVISNRIGYEESDQKKVGVDLVSTGCVATLRGIERSINGNYSLLVTGLVRVKIVDIVQKEPYVKLQLEPFINLPYGVSEADLQCLKRLIQQLLSRQKAVYLQKLMSEGNEQNVESVVDEVAFHLTKLSYGAKLSVLESASLSERIQVINKQASTDYGGNLVDGFEVDLINPKADHQQNIADPISSTTITPENITKILQRFLNKGGIQVPRMDESGSSVSNDANNNKPLSMEERIRTAGMSADTERMVLNEYRKLRGMPKQSPEHSSLRSYVEFMVGLPWKKSTSDQLDVQAARTKLDEDHFGMKDVKRRLLEYLAVSQMKSSLKGPIVCFVGPPGVGKTSIAKSISESIGRKFHRISLGGISDQSEIRGHRRTYIGSMAGRIIQGINQVAVNNPVILLDEIDKLRPGIHGDPSAALLEVLDPQQNHTFVDHYVNTPFDLSHVLFIATANSLDGIPGPLLDRMEIIRLSGYTMDEKIQIALKHLVEKQLKENGLDGRQNVTFEPDAIQSIVLGYTREAGVRGLELKIAAVCRALALRILEKKVPEANSGRGIVVKADMIEDILGLGMFGDVITNREGWEPGICTGLAWTEHGGEMLMVEATCSPADGKGDLTLTGHLGQVIRESATLAHKWLKNNTFLIDRKDCERKDLWKHDVHIHFPAGAISKDGPSAGVTIAVALVSLFLDRKVRRDTAMTGEITLRGIILPVGGIKEKLLAAKAGGCTRVLIPYANKKDIKELPESIKNSLEIIPVSRMTDALREALEDGPSLFHENIDNLLGLMSKL